MKKTRRLLAIVLTALLLTAPAIVRAETFSLGEDNYTMYPGQTFQLSAPQGKSISSWTSSNETVATVSNNGLVTALSDGVSVITAATYNGDSGSCAMLVRASAPSSIKLSSKNLLVDQRRKVTLTAEVQPYEASYIPVSWSSSNPSVAQVDGGVIKPVSLGKTIITASVPGTKKKASCTVTVKNLAVKSVVITPAKASVVVDNTISLEAKLVPLYSGEDAQQPFIWESSDDSIATVGENTGLVRGVSPGTVKIKALNPASGKFKYATITVKALGVESVSFTDDEEKTYMSMGETLDLTDRLVILPQNASDTPISWQSTNTAVATVDEYGVVTAVKTGVTTIKATAGGKSGKLDIRVRGGNVAEVTLSAGGDVILGGDYRDIIFQPYAPLSGEEKFDQLIAEYGNDYPFKNLQHIFNSDDITVINLEGVLTNTNKRKSGRPHYLRARAEYASTILKPAGIDVCCMANNHTLDYGFPGYKATRRALDSAGIKSMGHFDGEDCVINVKKNGISVKVGFCGMQMPVSRDNMQKQIGALRNTCDIVVASFHWANSLQWKANVTGYMRSNARAAIKFGADLVLGHHRHLPSGIERYGDKLIVYDLANLVTGLKHVGCDESMIFQITWRVDETGYIEEAGFKVIPVKTTVNTETYYFPQSNGYGKNGMPINVWQPAIATGSEARRIIDYVNANSLKVTVPYYYG